MGMIIGMPVQDTNFIYFICSRHRAMGHGFIRYPKGRNVERALGFSLTGTVSTSPNLAKARARRASNDCRAMRSLFS